jgi:hypothetical protein
VEQQPIESVETKELTMETPVPSPNENFAQVSDDIY